MVNASIVEIVQSLTHLIRSILFWNLIELVRILL